jgi:hypothetical protein
LLANILSSIMRRKVAAVEPPAAPQAPVVPPPAAPTVQSVPRGVPVFYSSLNLEMRQLEDGKWAAISSDWQVAAVENDPEAAIIKLWRYIYVHGGVVAMKIGNTQAEDSDARTS